VTFGAVVVLGYLLGSCPWGYWLVRVFRGEDVRRQGSGGIGASNVFRLYGRRLGVPVVLLDVAKGFVPALVGTVAVSPLCGILAGAAAMLGHWRPLFLRFERGGKTVAAAGGVFFAVAPLVGIATLVVWVVVFAATRYASVASIVAAMARTVSSRSRSSSPSSRTRWSATPVWLPIAASSSRSSSLKRPGPLWLSTYSAPSISSVVRSGTHITDRMPWPITLCPLAKRASALASLAFRRLDAAKARNSLKSREYASIVFSAAPRSAMSMSRKSPRSEPPSAVEMPSPATKSQAFPR